MAQAINWTIDVQVVGGPSSSAAGTTNVDAYDKIGVVVPGGDSGSPETASVDVQPGGAGKVKLLLLTSDLYGEDLTYDVDAGVSNVKLDSPQLLIGEGANGLLNAPPKTITFSNGMGVGSDANIVILVGRDAT